MTRSEFQPGPATDHYHTTIGVGEYELPEIATITVDVSAEQLLAMGDENLVAVGVVELIPAPGEGKIIVPRSMKTFFMPGEQAYGGSWDTSVFVSQEFSFDGSPDIFGVWTESISFYSPPVGGGRPSELANQPLQFSIESD